MKICLFINSLWAVDKLWIVTRECGKMPHKQATILLDNRLGIAYAVNSASDSASRKAPPGQKARFSMETLDLITEAILTICLALTIYFVVIVLFVF